MKIYGVFEKLFFPAGTEEVALPAGITKDDDGKLINEDGYFVNETGDLVDEEGNVIDPDEDEDDDEEEEEKPTTDPNVAEALEIYKALNNKETAPAMMQVLNARLAASGLTPVTKSELADISVQDILKEGFGEEYSFLHEKLGPALDKAINKAVNDKIGTKLSTLEQANQSLREEIAASKISQALDPIIEEMGAEEFDKIAPKLAQKMEQYPNNKNLPMKTYIKEMIKLVGGSEKSPKQQEKENKNVREAKRNLSTGARETKVKLGSKVPTIREAVQLAMQGKTVED